MEDLFAKILLGHLLGDYLLQSRKMAIEKSQKNIRGLIVCILHSIIYTISISLFLGKFDLIILMFIFLSHFPIDFWSLGSKWLKTIRGRDFIKAYESCEKYHEIDFVFSCIVYVIVDNTFHIMILYLGLQIIL